MANKKSQKNTIIGSIITVIILIILTITGNDSQIFKSTTSATNDNVSSEVLDNLENAAKVETKDENYKQGVELVLKQFKDVLKSKGVEEIEAIGTTFDPELHEAVSSVQDESKESQEIVQEYRKGYKFGNKVIRHSMVVVAN